MKHKVLGSLFVLAVALGVVGVAVRSTPTSPSVAAVAAKPAAGSTPNMERAAASYRVHETESERGMDFRGAGYTAKVAETGVRFGNSEGSVILGAPVLEQGSKSVGGTTGVFTHPAFGVARLEREGFTEEYILENNRMEQLFRIPAPLGEGALTVRVPVTTDFPCVIEEKKPGSDRFEALEFANGGIAFLSPSGEFRSAYHSAVAFDAAQNRIVLVPRFRNNEIVLEVPESFMAVATYPVVVDPWFVNISSSSTGGISNTGTASERPSMRGNLIAWADHSSGNFEIYVRLWTGLGFSELAGSASGGGISANAGQSINPSVAADNAGLPVVAWEDTSGGARSLYVRKYDGTSWVELDGSATQLGVTKGLNSCRNPSVGVMVGRVPGIVSPNPNGGPPTSTPPQTPLCPVVAWEMGGNIIVAAHYPGAPAQPVSTVNPQGLAAVPSGWYQLGQQLDGINVSKGTFTGSGVPSGANGGELPSLVVDGQNQVTVAFQTITGAGGFEIFASRWTLSGPPGPTEFEIRAQQDLTTMNMLPVANFTGIAAPGARNDNVSGTPTPSQYPSLAQDFQGGMSIAWQETENGGPINPATSSQIYLRRSTGGAWAALGGSASAGGISRTGLAYDGAAQVPPIPGNASTPSVAGGFNYIAVAWADTSNSRSSIYVRRCPIPGGTAWEQIGFQGSAFPPRTPLILPPAVPEQAPIGGVSQSNNFAFQPQIVDADDPFVVWADGSGATFDIFAAAFFPNGPGQANGIGTINPTFGLTIRQTATDPSLPGGAVDVPFGDFTTGGSIWLSSRVFTETLTPPGVSLWLEFEIQPAGVPFTFQATHQSLFVAPDAPPTTLPVPAPTSLTVLKFDGLPNTNYHYITRSIDQFSRVSPWFEQTNTGGVSFRVNSGSAGGGPVNIAPIVAGSTKSKGSCGLVGLEAAALLGLLRLLRRRRSA